MMENPRYPQCNGGVTDESPQSSPASIPPASGEEYELRLDCYLCKYLSECPTALRELEAELVSVSCSVQLHPGEGRVSVRRLAQPGAAGEGRNWKAEVDKVFDGYMCQYETDPHKVSALLKSCRSGQASDDVKVYCETGMAVVVGKHSQVNARLTDVKDSTVKHKESLSGEKFSIICLLGEAKLRLLWRDIENGLGQNFPGLKVAQGKAGQLVLEGSVKDVLEAQDWIFHKEKLVLERTVSFMSQHLLAFLRKAYGDPHVLSDFLGVGDEVKIELQDTVLRCYSFSADKLDDTEKALQEEFKEVKIDLPDFSSLSSKLQKMLKSETKAINQGRCRVQFLPGSDSTVCFLGHTKEVEDLSETVTKLILQSTLPLPFPELAQELPEFLRLYGFDPAGVTFHPFMFSSVPMVALEGPSSKVTEVRNKLGPFLDSLDQDRVSTHLVGALDLIEGNTLVSSYNLCDGLHVAVCHGDITKQKADALVNAANEDLDHCGGVAAALSKAGGPEVQSESNAIVKQIGKIPPGDVVVTTGGNLHCKKLLHAVGPVGGKAEGKERFLVGKIVQSALNMAETMGLKSIAMPCISSGVCGVPVTVCTEAIVTAVKEFGAQGGRSLSRIILIDSRAEVVMAMQEACNRLLQGTSTGPSTLNDLEIHMDADTQENSGGATARDPGVGVNVEFVQGALETQQVDALVSPMVENSPLSTPVGSTLSKIFGAQLKIGFRKKAGEKTLPGDAVLVEGLAGLPSSAVFFLNLIPWDGEENGTAVQVMRLGINKILTSCENRGFGSVALPVLGAGFRLRFPKSVIARVLLEEFHEFEQNRASVAPFLVRIIIHPSDTEASEVFKECLDIHQMDSASPTKRIILLGKTGSGKSTLANSLFGDEELFLTGHSFNSTTKRCQAETRSVNERSVTLIDTPGLFDTDKSENMESEIMKSITECAPGPHAFLFVFKVERFSEQEEAVVTKILTHFSEDALKYAVIVFTHGDQIPKENKIEDLVSENKSLSYLVQLCGGRCHVIDNKYWKSKQQNTYRSNQFQIEDLLDTIDKMIRENNGGYYTNEKLQKVSEEIKSEEVVIRQSFGHLSQEAVTERAKTNVSNRLLIQLTGTAAGALMGAFFGLSMMFGISITAVSNISGIYKLWKVLTGSKNKKAVNATVTKVLLVVAGGVVAAGGVVGGCVGYNAAKKAETPLDAAQKAAEAVSETHSTLFQIK